MEHRVMSDGTLLCKAAPGEEVVAALTALLEEKGVRAGVVTGIGACESAEIGFFDPKEKRYERHGLREPLELLSLSGNVSRGEDGKAFLHLHAVLGDRGTRARGGHLFALVADPTVEIFVRPFEGAVDRALVPERGLRLWRLATALALLPAAAGAQGLDDFLQRAHALRERNEGYVAAMRRAKAGSARAATPDAMTPEEAKALIVSRAAALGVPEEWSRAALDDPRLRVIDEVARRFGGPGGSRPAASYESYRRYFLTEARVAAGAAFLAERRALLESVRARYGVDPALLTALVGVETFYGARTGSFPALSALFTATVKVKRRSSWAAREAAELLRAAREQSWDPHALEGSHAGAFGYVQFVPSSYRALAVDFDRSGTRDLHQWPDALGSAAAYLARGGYRDGAPFTPESPIGRSLRAYNRSDDYVRVILELREAVLRRSRG